MPCPACACIHRVSMKKCAKQIHHRGSWWICFMASWTRHQNHVSYNLIHQRAFRCEQVTQHYKTQFYGLDLVLETERERERSLGDLNQLFWIHRCSQPTRQPRRSQLFPVTRRLESAVHLSIGHCRGTQRRPEPTISQPSAAKQSAKHQASVGDF